MIGLIEELSMNAWPALQTLHYDGWILHFANDYTRRANSISPLYPSSVGILKKIEACERIYLSQRQNAVFKMTEAAQPPNLDALLAERSYVRQAPTSVQTLALDKVHTPQIDAVREMQLTETWLEAYCRLNNVDRRHIPTMTQMLKRIISPRCFCALKHEDEIIAVGLAVAERGYVGLFDIVTASTFRSQGFGTQLLLHLLQWGKSTEAHSAYLQVMYDNAPALRLYAKLGFRESYTYWYRVKALARE